MMHRQMALVMPTDPVDISYLARIEDEVVLYSRVGVCGGGKVDAERGVG